MRGLAARIFRGETTGHTLQRTALVNEVLQNMLGANIDWQDRAHFFALSARMMRRILVNHANAKSAAKRGAGRIRDLVTVHAANATRGVP